MIRRWPTNGEKAMRVVAKYIMPIGGQATAAIIYHLQVAQPGSKSSSQILSQPIL